MDSIIALDIATITGWALWKAGMAKPRANLMTMPDVEDMGKWGCAFEDWAIPFFKLEGVTHVAIEAPFIYIREKQSTGAPTVNAHEIEKLISLVTVAKMCAVRVGATHSTVPRATAVKHFGGYGAGKRPEMKARCLAAAKLKGWNVKSEDIADALAVLDFTLYDRKIDGVPWNCQPAAFDALTVFRGQGVRAADIPKSPSHLLNSALSFERERHGE